MDNDTIIAQHKADKKTSQDFKERRFNQWNENYLLYRDKVSTNRLTQRQPVNVPIIRETIQTWISKIDETPLLKFETRGQGNQDKSGEIVLNELWAYYHDKLKLDILDNVDKKVVGLQGRSFKKWGFTKGEIFCDLIDPYDVEIDPRTNIFDLNSADFVIHTHIFRSLRNILANPKYSQEGKDALKIYLDSKQGILKAKDDIQNWTARNERLIALGVQNYDNFVSNDILVEINEDYKLMWDNDKQKFIRYLIVIATDNVVLYKQPLREAIGIDRLPIVTWASDPEITDIWSDGIADSVRTFNKITNMYISQDLENRTYSNFGMYFFNTLNGTFQPRAFEPKPFGMYGVPGDPSTIIKQMEIKTLGDTTNQIDWLKNLIQSSVAQTPTERGVLETNTTLGQTQLSFQQSQVRNQVVSKNFRDAWKESGEIFYDLLKSNSHGVVTLYKKGGDGNWYQKDVVKSDWFHPLGYECKVETKAEADVASDFDLKKIQYVKNSFPNNPVAQQIANKKILELVDWTPEEVDAVMQSEGSGQQNMIADPMNQAQGDQTEAPSGANNPQDSVMNGNQTALTGK